MNGRGGKKIRENTQPSVNVPKCSGSGTQMSSYLKLETSEHLFQAGHPLDRLPWSKPHTAKTNKNEPSFHFTFIHRNLRVPARSQQPAGHRPSSFHSQNTHQHGGKTFHGKQGQRQQRREHLGNHLAPVETHLGGARHLPSQPARVLKHDEVKKKKASKQGKRLQTYFETYE